MKSRAFILLTLFAVPSCDGPKPEPELSFTENPQQYCQSQNDRWLASILDRINDAMPAALVSGSAQFERLHIQDRLDGNAGTREIQIRFTAEASNGETVAMSAYAGIDPDSCALAGLEAQVGFDRFNPPLRFAVP